MTPLLTKEEIEALISQWRCDPGYIGHSDKIEAALRDALRRAEEAEADARTFRDAGANLLVEQAEAEARIAELTAALEPFGRVAAAIPPSVGNSTRVVVGCSTHKPKVADFRRAAALQQQPDEEQGNG